MKIENRAPKDALEPYHHSKNTANRYKILLLIGPAFVAGAWRFGPGALTSAVQAGSQYGYQLLWVIALSGILMFYFNDMAVRIGLSTKGVSLVDTIKSNISHTIGVLAGFGVFFITLCFSVGNAIGSGIALQLLFGGSVVSVQ